MQDREGEGIGMALDLSLGRRSVLRGAATVLAAGGLVAPSAAQAADRIPDAASLRDFGAKGDGSADDTAALISAVAQSAAAKVPLFAPPGSYLIGAQVVLPPKVTIFGLDRNNTSFLLGKPKAGFFLTGPHVTLANLSVDGQWLANYCLFAPDDIWTGSLLAENCEFANAEKANLYLGRRADAFRISHSWIRRAGRRDLTKRRPAPITPGAMGAVIRTEGQFIATNIGSATGSLLRHEGKRLLFLGGRLNFGYQHLAHVTGYDSAQWTTVIFHGTYLENPNVLSDRGAVNPVGRPGLLADGPFARVSILGAQKFHVQKARAGIEAVNGAHVHYQGPMPTFANRQKRRSRSYLFSTANGLTPGRITFSHVELRRPEEDWAGVAKCRPSADGLTVVPDHYVKVARLHNGSNTASIRPVNASLSVDASAGLSEGGALRITANKKGGPHGAVLEVRPVGLKGELVMIVAVVKGRASNPLARQRLEIVGRGLILNGPESCVVNHEEKTVGAQDLGAWTWLQLFCVIADDTEPAKLTVFHNDNQASDRGETLVDHIDLYVVQPKRPGIAW